MVFNIFATKTGYDTQDVQGYTLQNTVNRDKKRTRVVLNYIPDEP